ncbi:MAG: ice-binding family protein [Pelobacteraceae bacterium]
MNACKGFSKLWFLALLLVAFVAGCASNDPEVINSPRGITGYSLAGVTGTIDQPASTIAVTMPYGANVTSLVATFTTTGSVAVGTVAQASGVSANNFTGPVVYTVTSPDGTTTTYTVLVTVAPISAKAITAYSLAGAAGIINEPAKTIAVTVPNGTNVSALIATFTSTGSSVKVGTTLQASVVTANNFTNPVAYTVTAADGTTATYTVTVSTASNSAKAITAYSFAGFTGAAGVINDATKTIAVTVPAGTSVTALVATFTTTGTGVKVGSAVQTSTATANNFTGPVAYTVTATNGTTETYTVTVTAASNAAKDITAYSFSGSAGVINTATKTIAVTVPAGTNVTALVATFTTTGTGVKVGSAVQTSTATANNFTSPVVYTVTAADGSTATYTVTVTVASATNSAKAITAYSFTGSAGVINQSAKTIAVTVPDGTTVTALAATFTTTGTTVKVGNTVQTSGSTTNNFSSPVAYTVTAADGTTATYTVTVNAAVLNGPPPVNLGTAENFVILAKTGVSTTGTSAVVGDIGVSPAAASFITGFSLIADSTNTFSRSSLVTGKIYAANYAPPTPANMTAAISDMQTAFTDAAGRTTPDFTELGAGNISGLTLVPGLYKWGTGVLVTNAGVTLSGGPNAVWIFQIAGNLTVNNSANITLSGGAQAKNVFWQVAGQATLGTAAHFNGIILSQTLISLNTGAAMNGRALAQTAVTLNANAVTQP